MSTVSAGSPFAATSAMASEDMSRARTANTCFDNNKDLINPSPGVTAIPLLANSL